MKRINRSKLIDELQELKQGFWNAAHLSKEDHELWYISMMPYYKQVDRMIVDLGGESNICNCDFCNSDSEHSYTNKK